MAGQSNKTMRFVVVMAVHAVLLGYGQAPAFAQTAPSETIAAQVDFDLPSSTLYEALHAFSRQTGIPVTILPGTPDGIHSTAVKGRFAPADALTKLLGVNSVPFRFVGGALVVGRASAEADEVEVLGPVTVVGAMPQAVMPGESGSSGLTVLGQDMIKAIGTPDKDPMRLLRVMPNVNFDNSQYKVSQSGGTGTLSEQDLTPERVSISGGKVYENKLLLDGMDNTSVFDVTTTSEGDADKIAIHNPMSLFVNSDILREVAVYDSNVPARYGGFTGGVIDMRTREPAAKFGGSAGYTRQTNKWVHYRNDWDSSTVVQSPIFRKNAYDMVVDVPINKRVRTMVAASQEQAAQERVPIANYSDGENSVTSSTRSSYLGSVSTDIGENTNLVVKGLYAPYTQEYSRANMAEDKLETVGNNYQFGADLRHDGNDIKANLSLGVVHSGYERDAPDTAYTWNRSGSKSALCAGGTSCVEGGYGDITDAQDDFQAKADVTKTALGVEWSSGIDYRHTTARRVREQDAKVYFSLASNTVVNAGVVCADPNDSACIPGEQVLMRRTTYLARDTSVSTDNIGYWTQGQKELPLDWGLLQGIDLRAGARADYNDYFGNINWAPRLSSTLRFPSDVALTLAANRYYSADSLVYAMYANTPSGLTQDRTAGVGGVYSNTWSAATPSYIYDSASVRTPYSDERTAALTLPLLWGDGRLKYVVRHTRDEIAMKITTVGSVVKRRPTNDGWTDYKSTSLEWLKSMGNHAFLVNAAWSDTKRNNETYLESAEDEVTTKIYYNGAVIPKGQLAMIADNFAQPIVLNAAWTSKWLEDALTVNLTGKYRFAREEIASADRTIKVGTTSYSVYEKVTRNPIVRFDASASYKIDTWGDQDLELLAFVENVFNARSQTAESTAPFERGRAYWFGVRYLF